MAKHIVNGKGNFGYKIEWTEGGTTTMWFETASQRDSAFKRDKNGLSRDTFRKFFKKDR